MSRFHLLFDVLGQLARRRFQLAEQYFAKVGLNHTEARILSLLHQSEGTSAQDDIANKMNIDRSNVGRALKNLEGRGLVMRAKSTQDKRVFMIQLTDEGQSCVAQITEIKNHIIDTFFGEMSEDEAAVVYGLLKKIAN
jgi:DNA-binding MarR family transcriptional regulator